MVISKKRIIASAMALSIFTSMAAMNASAAEVTGVQESNPYTISTRVVAGHRTVVASAPKVGSYVWNGSPILSYKVKSATTKNNIITLKTDEYSNADNATQSKPTGKTKTFTLEKGVARNFVFGAAVHNADSKTITTYVSLRGNKNNSTTNPGITTAVLKNAGSFSVTYGKKTTVYTGTANIKAYDINNNVKTYKVSIRYCEEYNSSAKTIAATPYNGYTKKALVGSSKVNFEKTGTFEQITTSRYLSLQ